MNTCACAEAHETRRVVLTGGPGAGKTAVLEMVRNSLCRHVRVLPEAASIVFGGGFPREDDPTCRRAAQRAIYFVQRELEVTGEAHAPAVLLCDRATLDGLAYWPGPVEDFWDSTHTTLAAELARYDLVVHLRTPRSSQGYNHQNPLRTESASAAAQIDERISAVWEQHPRRVVVEASGDFLDKAITALAVLRAELPDCCASHLDAATAGADHGASSPT
jgi:predicted ATPase